MSRKTRTTLIVPAVALLLVAGYACSKSGSSGSSPDDEAGEAAPPAPRIVSGGELYQPPDPLPEGRPGDVIQATAPEPIDGGTRQNILYLSTTTDGDPTAVSGALFVPDHPAPDAPVLSMAHGTIGLADCAAPSRDATSGEPEIAFFGGLAQEGRPESLFRHGAIVVASDYEGLGTPGVHPYLVGRSEGAGVLDAIRAARRVTETEGDAVVIGHSQGGGAAIWAAQMAADYAPDAHLVGAVAAAPALELRRMAPLVGGSDYAAYLFMVAGGFQAAYPELDLGDYMTPAGLEATEALATTCDEEAFTGLAGARLEDYFTADMANVDPFARLLDENTPGDIATDVPILMVYGEADEQLPVRSSEWFLERTCRTGGFTVERRTYPGASHHSVLVDALPDIRTFVADRLAARPPASTPCP
jgi:pimeloyl-ACP methyl ester carboxylesterase